MRRAGRPGGVAPGRDGVVLLEDLPEDPRALPLLDGEHPLPGVVLPEEQVEHKPDRGRKKRTVSPAVDISGEPPYIHAEKEARMLVARG